MQGGLTPPFILPFQIPYEFIYNTQEENKTELTDAENGVNWNTILTFLLSYLSNSSKGSLLHYTEQERPTNMFTTKQS